MDERDTPEQDLNRWQGEGGALAARPINVARSPASSRVQRLLRISRKVGVAVAGGAVLLAGIALIFLPGPAIIVIPLGLAVLATEFVWAARLLRGLKERAARAVQRVRRAVGARPRALPREPASARTT
jgi:uncharacterized protein (TIGR02611 family)